MGQSTMPKLFPQGAYFPKKTVLLLALFFGSASASPSFASQSVSANTCANVFGVTSGSKYDVSRVNSDSPKKGFLGTLKTIFGKSKELPSSPRQQSLTAVRLSGNQLTQKNSVQDNLKQVQQIVNHANNTLLGEITPPEVVFVSFNENMQSTGASISYYEMNLANSENLPLKFLKNFSQGSSQKEAVPIITHEYFHLILNQIIGNHSPEYKTRLEKTLMESQGQRSAHKANQLKGRIPRLEREATLAGYLITSLKDLKKRKKDEPSIFARDQLKEITQVYMEEIKRDDLFADIKFSWENIDEMIAMFEKFRNDSLTQAQKLRDLQQANQENAQQTKLAEEDQVPIEQIHTFYSSAIHELFADLGTVLLTGDPSVLSSLLNSPPRDFDRTLTMDEYIKEYYALGTSGKRSPHIFFSYHRAILWQDYFSKTSKEQWPRMLKALADAFAKEIIQNPENIYVEVKDNTGVRKATYVDFVLAGRHLEEVIRNSLEHP